MASSGLSLFGVSRDLSEARPTRLKIEFLRLELFDLADPWRNNGVEVDRGRRRGMVRPDTDGNKPVDGIWSSLGTCSGFEGDIARPSKRSALLGKRRDVSSPSTTVSS